MDGSHKHKIPNLGANLSCIEVRTHKVSAEMGDIFNKSIGGQRRLLVRDLMLKSEERLCLELWDRRMLSWWDTDIKYNNKPTNLPTARGASFHLIVFFISTFLLDSSIRTEVWSRPTRKDVSVYLEIVGSNDLELLVGNSSFGFPSETWKMQ